MHPFLRAIPWQRRQPPRLLPVCLGHQEREDFPPPLFGFVAAFVVEAWYLIVLRVLNAADRILVPVLVLQSCTWRT